MKNRWICTPNKAIRLKMWELRCSITGRLLPDLRIDVSPDHLLSAVNQIRNQLSIATRLGRDFEQFHGFMLLHTDDFREPLDAALAVYHAYRGALETLKASANDALKLPGPSGSDANGLRDQLASLCESILERLMTIRADLAALEVLGLGIPIPSGNGQMERGSVPLERRGDGRLPEALMETEMSPILDQEETNGQPPAKG